MSYDYPDVAWRGIQAGEVVNVSVSMLGELDLGLSPDETLTGTPTVEVSTGGPEVVEGTPTLNAASIRVDGVTVPTSKAILFQLDASETEPGDYYIVVACGTNKGQTRKLRVGLSVESGDP